MKILGIKDDKIYKAMVCARCGDAFFREYIGTNYLDGGYTRIENFSERPEGWVDHREIGTFCPVCENIYQSTLQSFMNYTE